MLLFIYLVFVLFLKICCYVTCFCCRVLDFKLCFEFATVFCLAVVPFVFVFWIQCCVFEFDVVLSVLPSCFYLLLLFVFTAFLFCSAFVCVCFDTMFSLVCPYLYTVVGGYLAMSYMSRMWP